MTNKGGPSPFQDLPSDVLKEIFKYLSDKDIENFTMVCRANRNKMNSPAVDQFWQPKLNILRRLDPTVPMQPPEGTPPDTAWRYPLFKKYFAKINQSQLTEITYLQKALEADNPPHIPEEIAKKLRAIKSPAEKISELEERHNILNQINEAIIRQKINTAEIELNCTSCHLTRFPGTLITDPTLKDYWGTLEYLLLDNNLLTAIPVEIGKLVKLVKLGLNHNQLTTIPAEIGGLKSLQWLTLHHNQLTAVPAEIKRLKKLMILHLANNHLTAVPAEIGQLVTLHALLLNNNLLTAVPAEIGQLVALQELYLNNNQ